jgi:uncharacterized membrane protein YfcA
MLIADLLQPEILIFAPLIVFAAYVVFGVTGFGSTLIAIPLLAHLFPLKFAVPFFVILDCVGAFNMGLRLRADVMRNELLLLIPFMAIGILSGVWLLLRLHPELLLGGLGAFVLLFAGPRHQSASSAAQRPRCSALAAPSMFFSWPGAAPVLRKSAQPCRLFSCSLP